MDKASLVTRDTDEDRLLVGNYTGVLSPRFFVEAQYSERVYRISVRARSSPTW